MAAIVIVSSCFLSGDSSSAEENTNFRYGIEGNNLVFSTPDEATAGGSFRLAVKEGQRAEISVQLVDVFSTAAGTKRSIPVKSSPFTADGLVTFKKKYPPYEPSEDFQYFDISFRFKEDVALDRPVLGGLSISLVPENLTGEETTVQSSIVATFAYLPAELNMEDYGPALTLTGPKIEREDSDFFPLNLLPDPPFLQNHGDLILSYELTNTGEIFLETLTEVNVEQVGLFGQQDESIFSHSKKAFLVPDQITEETIGITQGQLDNQPLGIGVYRFTLTSTGQLGDVIGTSAESQQILLVFPWKQGLIALGLVAVFRRRIGRAFSWVFAYGRALKDFRYSRDTKSGVSSKPILAPSPKPILAPSPKLGVAVNESPTTTNQAATSPSPSRTATPTASIPQATRARPLYPFWYEPPKKSGDS